MAAIFSITSATRKIVPSSKWRPITIVPIGRPSEKPALTDTAGCPVASKGAVLSRLPKQLAMTSVKQLN